MSLRLESSAVLSLEEEHGIGCPRCYRPILVSATIGAGPGPGRSRGPTFACWACFRYFQKHLWKVDEVSVQLICSLVATYNDNGATYLWVRRGLAAHFGVGGASCGSQLAWFCGACAGSSSIRALPSSFLRARKLCMISDNLWIRSVGVSERLRDKGAAPL